MIEIDYHVIQKALSDVDDECGDIGAVKIDDDHCLIALIDVLGHGDEAHDVALMAQACLLEHYHQGPAQSIKGLHEHLKGTRGAVACVCKLDIQTGILTYSNMGNICARIMGNNPARLSGKDGVIGYMIPSPAENQIKLYPGDILILHSDGIKEHFDPIDYPDILMGDAKNITTGFLNKLSKNSDDASCIAMRYGI
jgi:negative regulator of sigma-B (phosphoserine phosphatase)